MINYLITHQRRARCLKKRLWACAVAEDGISALHACAEHMKNKHIKGLYMYIKHACTIYIDASLICKQISLSHTHTGSQSLNVHQETKELTESRTHWLVGHWKHKEVIMNNPDTHRCNTVSLCGAKISPNCLVMMRNVYSRAIHKERISCQREALDDVMWYSDIIPVVWINTQIRLASKTQAVSLMIYSLTSKYNVFYIPIHNSLELHTGSPWHLLHPPPCHR